MTHRLEKTTSEVYTIRFDNHSDWFVQATIIEDRGYLALHTSHGDWQYRWCSPGIPFKKFLTSIDGDYLMRKLGLRTYFEGEETVNRIKQDIIEKRKELDISAEEARSFMDMIKPKKRSVLNYRFSTSSVGEFYRSFDEGVGRELVEKIYEDITYVPCYVGYDPSLKFFISDLWPSFIEELKKEIK